MDNDLANEELTASEDVKTFDFGRNSGYEHIVADRSCKAGWCDGSAYPHTCARAGCDGLVHANFGDEDSDCNYWLYTQCDVCGKSE